MRPGGEPAQPLRLRRLEEAEAWLEALAGSRFVARIAMGSATADLSLVRCAAPGVPAWHARGEDGWLAFGEPDAFCALLTGIDPGAAGSHEALRQALTASAFAGLPAPVARLLGFPQGSSGQPPAPACWMRLDCRLEGAHAATWIGAGTATWRALLGRPPWRRQGRQPPPFLPALPLRIPILAAETTLSAGELAGLERGDLLLPESCRFGPDGSGDLRLGPRLLAVRWHPAAGALAIEHVQSWSPTMSNGDASTFSPPLADPATPGPDGETAAPPPLAEDITALRDHPIRLRFVLGELELPLGALSQLAPGQLLPLRDGLPPAVGILANGLPVGRGELVEWDGRLGVQITRWNSPN